MFAKLLALILTSALTAAALLALRHERLECAHRAARLQRAAEQRTHDLWTLRSEVVAATRTEAVRAAMAASELRWLAITPPAVPAGIDDVRLVNAGAAP